MEHKFHIHFSEMINTKSGVNSKLSSRQRVILNSWLREYMTWGFVWLSFLFRQFTDHRFLPGQYKILDKQTPFFPRMILIPSSDDSLGFIISPYSQTTLLVWRLFNRSSINSTVFQVSSKHLVFKCYFGKCLVLLTLSVLAIRTLTISTMHIFKSKTLPENTFTLNILTQVFLTAKITTAKYHLIVTYLGYRNGVIWHLQKLYNWRINNCQVSGSPRNTG